MPRYFFDMVDAGNVIRDDVGVDLPDDEAARRQVGKLLPDLARRGLPDGDAHKFECTARNEAGRPVYRASMTYRGSLVSPEAGRPVS